MITNIFLQDYIEREISSKREHGNFPLSKIRPTTFFSINPNQIIKKNTKHVNKKNFISELSQKINENHCPASRKPEIPLELHI